MALLEGHSTILYGDELYVFGGKDNKTGQLLNTLWKVSVPSSQVAATQYTQAQQAANGGDDSLFKNNNNTNSKLSATELATMGSGAVATIVSTTGPVPTPRCYHAVSLRPPFMLVWGGTTLHPATVINPRGERVSEDRCAETVIFALHLETREWAVHVLSGKDSRCPRPRCHAAMTPTAHSVLMYGGYPNTTDEDTGSAHVEPNHWSVFEIGADAVVRSNARVGSEVPMLWGHTALFAHGCLCVFGGVDFATMTETNALCLFSLEEKRWRWAEFALAPEARALHTAVLHGSNMFIYGGFTGRPDRTDHPTFNDVWRFSLNTGLWDECACTGAHPPARSGHTSTIVQHNMFVIGGLEGNRENLADQCTMAVLDLHTFHWNMCPIYFPLHGGDTRGIGNHNNNNNDSTNMNGGGGGGLYDQNINNNSSDLYQNNSLVAASPLTPRTSNMMFGNNLRSSSYENNNNNGTNSPERTNSTSYIPPNLRRSNVSLTAVGSAGNNNNNNNNQNSPNTNRFAMSGTVLGRNGSSGWGQNQNQQQNSATATTTPNRKTPNNSQQSQQEKELMEAASITGFGNLTASGGGAGNGLLNHRFGSGGNMNARAGNNNNTSGGGIPSATLNGMSGGSRSPSTALNLPGSALASQFGAIPKNTPPSLNTNANNQNQPRSNSYSMFADQIQQQQQQMMNQQQQQQPRSNSPNSSARGGGGGGVFSASNYPLPSYLSGSGNNNNTNQNQQNISNSNSNNPSSILGGFNNQSFLNSSPPSNRNNNNHPANESLNRSPSSSRGHSPYTGSPTTAGEISHHNHHHHQQQFPSNPNNNSNNNNNNNNNNRYQNPNNIIRSPSNALLSNVNRYDHQTQNQMLADKERNMMAAQQMQHDANQQIANTQSQYARQGVNDAVTSAKDGGEGGFDWAINESRSGTVNNNAPNMYDPSRSNNREQTPGDYHQERSQARNPGEGRQGSPAQTNVWNTDPDQLPGRRPYDSNISFATGAFQAPAHSLKQRADELAQQQAIQQHINETQQYQMMNQQQNNNAGGGFGVRPTGGLGRSNSVGLGMPPSMIDTMMMNHNTNNNNHMRNSPSRSSSSASFGRRSMMRTL